MSVNGWFAHLDNSTNSKPGLRRADTFAMLDEKSEANMATEFMSRKRSSVRDLPFLQITFESICSRLHVHDSIVRTVSRADVPTFSFERVNMSQPAYSKFA
jgi:hypothetical protein